MSENKITLITIGNLNPEANKYLQKYASVVSPLLLEAGGKPIFRIEHKETLVGDNPPSVVLGMEFPDEESVQKVFASPKYQEAIQYRDLAFANINIIMGKAL
jgi:uncharacterized protein (DUF1330 family)